MGCGETKENIQSQMLILLLTKSQIKEERALIIKKYEIITGKSLKRPKIPNYIAEPDCNNCITDKGKKRHNKITKNKSKNKKRKFYDSKKTQSNKFDENDISSIKLDYESFDYSSSHENKFN